jgi:hypothetical protein
MTAADLQKLIEKVKTLTPPEREEVRRAMDLPPPATDDDELDRRLLESGLVRQLPAPAGPRTNPEPIQIEGKPLSQTIIEERK